MFLYWGDQRYGPNQLAGRPLLPRLTGARWPLQCVSYSVRACVSPPGKELLSIPSRVVVSHLEVCVGVSPSSEPSTAFSHLEITGWHLGWRSGRGAREGEGSLPGVEGRRGGGLRDRSPNGFQK